MRRHESNRLRTVVLLAALPVLGLISCSNVRSSTTGCSDDVREWILPHVDNPPALSLDVDAWRNIGAKRIYIASECTTGRADPFPVEVFGLWTNDTVRFLFLIPYKDLHLWPISPATGNDRDRLWERDVVELFLGDVADDMHRYREFEVAPTGERLDLDIDLSRQLHDTFWNSRWITAAKIDEASHRWYAAVQIPLSDVTVRPVRAGTRLRANFYLIDGPPPDSQRRFLCWRPTCSPGQDPNHVPERFGTVVFGAAK